MHGKKEGLVGHKLWWAYAVATCGLLCAIPLLLPSRAAADSPPIESAPRAVAVPNTLAALVQTAAIVEGTVSSIANEYAEDTGPWTIVTLSDLVTHRGRLASSGLPEKVVIRQMGGLLPDGRTLVASHVPTFLKGARYVVFLRNTSWYLSPVLSNVALRKESERGRTFLVDQDQRVLTGVNRAGLRFSAPVYIANELSAATPGRRTSIDIPTQAMDVDSLLASLDAEATARGIAISGNFYDEPVTRARKRPVARANPGTILGQPGDELSPGEQDTTRPKDEVAQ